MRRTALSFLPLFGFAAFLFLTELAYFANARKPPEGFWDLAGFGWGFGLAAWVVSDARRRRCTPCYEFGFFVIACLPLTLPWYAFWTRGWRGFGLLALFYALLATPEIAEIFGLLVFRGRMP